MLLDCVGTAMGPGGLKVDLGQPLGSLRLPCGFYDSQSASRSCDARSMSAMSLRCYKVRSLSFSTRKPCDIIEKCFSFNELHDEDCACYRPGWVASESCDVRWPNHAMLCDGLCALCVKTAMGLRRCDVCVSPCLCGSTYGYGYWARLMPLALGPSSMSCGRWRPLIQMILCSSSW